MAEAVSTGNQITKVPGKAWRVVFAGTAVNLCLGILYAWSVWKGVLVNKTKADAGEIMTGINAGWPYLTDAQGTVAFFLCGLIFAIFMVPGGRIQDKYGPKIGATLGGLCLAAGCILAGVMKSYEGLVVGFGILGGIGMGIGYAAPTPAAVKWFGPHRRGLIVGLVVGGYGGAALYIAPLANYLIKNYGLSGSFIGLGCLFAVVVIIAGQLLEWPPTGYVAPQPTVTAAQAAATAIKQTAHDWTTGEMLKTWQYYALVLMFVGSAQSGLLVIANAAPVLAKTAGKLEFFVANAWLLASFGGLVNASGRIGTGTYSDKIGRANAYMLNGIVAAGLGLATPWIISSGNVFLLFCAVGIAFWQYGGGLSMLPAFTADFYGTKHLGFNYGMVFLGWGIAFLVPLGAGYLKDYYGNYDLAFQISSGILIAAVILCKLTKRPKWST